MKKVFLAVLILVLVVCAVGWVITYQALVATQSMWLDTMVSLNEVQLQLQNTTRSLEKTQQVLQDTTNNLAVTQLDLTKTQQDLIEQQDQTAKYVQLYESNVEELKNREEELEALTEELLASQQESQRFQTELNELEKKLELYEDTLGTQVFSGIMPPYKSGDLSRITLINDGASTNPTWKQLEAFLREDKTDKTLYVTGIYECGNYAKDLHNNAEAKGICAAFVVVHFSSDTPHALNAFKTLDRGLVYIDVTGYSSSVSLPNLDTKVQLEKDERYKRALLFPDSWRLQREEQRLVKIIEIYW